MGTVPEILFELEKVTQYDLYFLFDIDVPWVPDGIRDLNDKREEMMRIFKEELIKRKIPFILVKGTWAQREEIIKKAVDSLIS